MHEPAPLEWTPTGFEVALRCSPRADALARAANWTAGVLIGGGLGLAGLLAAVGAKPPVPIGWIALGPSYVGMALMMGLLGVSFAVRRRDRTRVEVDGHRLRVIGVTGAVRFEALLEEPLEVGLEGRTLTLRAAGEPIALDCSENTPPDLARVVEAIEEAAMARRDAARAPDAHAERAIRELRRALPRSDG